jgi:tRNA (cytidine/uridine-2'-O-)-methyltransferase
LTVIHKPPLHVVLHQPEIHYNTGNIGRTCVAVGAKLWLVKPLGFNIDDASVRRAGLDYWELLDLEVVENWAELVERLPTDSHWYFTKKGVRSHWDADFQPGAVMVFGSESPEVRCLNLSNAAALACYEAFRQWGGLPDAAINPAGGFSS